MIIVMLSGTSACGKTSCAEELKDIFEAYNTKSEIVRSTLRKSSIDRGFPTEGDTMVLSNDEKLNLQNSKILDYLRHISISIDNAEKDGVEYLILERSPIDHISYTDWLLPAGTITEAARSFSVWGVSEFLRQTAERFPIFIQLFPASPPWIPKNDGFRYETQGKSDVWMSHMILNTEKMVINVNRLYNRILPITVSYPESLVRKQSTEERATGLATAIRSMNVTRN